MSRVTVEEVVREGRRGSARLAEVVADPARYVNMVLLLRIGCELVATVIVADLCISWLDETWRAYVTAAAIMIVVSYVVIGVGPRTLGIQHADRIALARRRRHPPGDPGVRAAAPAADRARQRADPGKGFREGPFASGRNCATWSTWPSSAASSNRSSAR